MERLHPALIQTHDGQPVKAQITNRDFFKPAHVGTPGYGPAEVFLQNICGDLFAGYTENRTHKWHLRLWSAIALIYFRTKAAAPWCHLICFSFRAPSSPGDYNVPPVTPLLLAFAFSLDLEGFFSWTLIRDFHHLPLS